MLIRVPNFTVENVYIRGYGDAITFDASKSTNFIVRGVRSSGHDDWIENDFQNSGLVDDCLNEGSYAGFSAKKYGGNSGDGSNNIVTIQNSFIYLKDQIGVYGSRTVPGHEEFFKLDSTAPRFILKNNVFRLDSNNGASNQWGLPSTKIAECSNNFLVWFGSVTESPRITLPSCVQITRDKSVWDNAVKNWKVRHGYSD